MNQKEESAREREKEIERVGIHWTGGFREGSTKGGGKLCTVGGSRGWGEGLEKTNVSDFCDRV